MHNQVSFLMQLKIEHVDTLRELQELIANFVSDRNWGEFHSPKNLSMSIAIEAGELMEIYQWMTSTQATDKSLEDEETRNQLKDELADVLIYCLSLANTTKINVEEIIKDKMKRNNLRFPVGQSL